VPLRPRHPLLGTPRRTGHRARLSRPAIEAAGAIAERGEIGAGFVVADVHDAATALGGRPFEIVYTGLGALNWLPDLERWADLVAALLEPGGASSYTSTNTRCSRAGPSSSRRWAATTGCPLTAPGCR